LEPQEFYSENLSAMSGETDRLVGLARMINPSDRSLAYDMLLATGEQAAIALLTMAIEKKGGRAKPYVGSQVRVLTNTMHSRARREN
jgi:aspartate kinase